MHLMRGRGDYLTGKSMLTVQMKSIIIIIMQSAVCVRSIDTVCKVLYVCEVLIRYAKCCMCAKY